VTVLGAMTDEDVITLELLETLFDVLFVLICV
jgi:hypothetical protein